MTISVESTSTKILVTLKGLDGPFILQRAFYKDRTWLTYTENGFVFLEDNPEISPKTLEAGDFVDGFELTDGLYEYRFYKASIENPTWKDFTMSKWV